MCERENKDKSDIITKMEETEEKLTENVNKLKGELTITKTNLRSVKTEIEHYQSKIC